MKKYVKSSDISGINPFDGFKVGDEVRFYHPDYGRATVGVIDKIEPGGEYLYIRENDDGLYEVDRDDILNEGCILEHYTYTPFEHSFTNSQKCKSLESIIEFLHNTDKPIRYTYGYAWKNPTTKNKFISKDDAIRLVQRDDFTDIKEYPDYVRINKYSANDMW